MKKITSIDWNDDGQTLKAKPCKNYSYDVAAMDDRVGNAIYLDDKAVLLSPKQSMAMGQWLILNVAREALAESQIKQDQAKSNEIIKDLDAFSDEIDNLGHRFAPSQKADEIEKFIKAAAGLDPAHILAHKNNILQLAEAAVCDDPQSKARTLESLIDWIESIKAL